MGGVAQLWALTISFQIAAGRKTGFFEPLSNWLFGKQNESFDN